MTEPTTVHLLCAGAAKGLVQALEPLLADTLGVALHAQFGAVGAMKEALLAGEPCDLMVVTDSMVQGLIGEGRLQAGTQQALGRVLTGVAVCAGQSVPAVDAPEALRAALLAADAVYFPDPVRATAGIHFFKVLQALGIAEALQPRCRTFANGATAMRELALAASPRAIGCTQVSEILYTPGVRLAGALPAQFELATLYSGAVASQARAPAQAAAVLTLLAGPAALDLRVQGGIEP